MGPDGFAWRGFSQKKGIKGPLWAAGLSISRVPTYALRRVSTRKGRSPLGPRPEKPGLLPYDESVSDHVAQALVLGRCQHRDEGHKVEEEPVHDA
jgi:hypothetical protein